MTTALKTPLSDRPAAPERAQRADARRNRERVITAARKVMARDGLDAQMEDIARAAKVGVGTVYRHFPSKDEIVEALAFDRFERLRDAALDAMGIADPWDSFEAFIRTAAHIQTEDRALSEVLTSRPEVMQPAAQSVDMLGLTAQILTRAQKAGVVRKDARPEDIPMVMCALAGTFHNPFAETDRYVGIMLDGLRVQGTGQTRLR
jgi:AcrR family transcriptional regulator